MGSALYTSRVLACNALFIYSTIDRSENMSLYYGGIEIIQKRKFQVCLVPFFINTQGHAQLPPAFTEAEQSIGVCCRKELVEKLDDQPKELKTKTLPFLWVEQVKRPSVCFFNDLGLTPLQRVLHSALGIANTQGVNIALFLFRNHFGQYYIPEQTIVETSIEECLAFNFGRPDIDLHIVLSTLDQFAYARLKSCKDAKQECTPHFE